MPSQKAQTLYEVLQVRSDATTQDVRTAWRRLAQEHHPDRGGAADPEAMTRINHAYEVLSDPDRRARYDQQLLAVRKPRRRGLLYALRQRGPLLTAVAVGATVLLAGGAWTVLGRQPAAPVAALPSDPAPSPAAATDEPPLRLIPSRSIESWAPTRTAQPGTSLVHPTASR